VASGRALGAVGTVVSGEAGADLGAAGSVEVVGRAVVGDVLALPAPFDF
jgi:hypothetical protein